MVGISSYGSTSFLSTLKFCPCILTMARVAITRLRVDFFSFTAICARTTGSAA